MAEPDLKAYREAKNGFFREFLDSEKEIAATIEAISNRIAGHIYQAYLNSGVTKKICASLTEALQAASKAITAANALDLHEAEATYRGWHDQVLSLFLDVNGVYSQAVVERDVFGSNKPHNLVLKKLPTDSAIVAIDIVLELIYQNQRISGPPNRIPRCRIAPLPRLRVVRSPTGRALSREAV